MNPAQAKLFSWTLASLSAAGLVAFLFLRVMDYQSALEPVSRERMTEVLNDTPSIVSEAGRSAVDYDQVKAALIAYKWNAPPPAKIDTTERQREVIVAPTEKSVADLVKVLGFSVYGPDSERSQAIVKYLPESRVQPPPPEPGMPVRDGVRLRVGSRLAAPIDHIRIASITVYGVEFAFDEEGRESETLLPADFDLSSRLAHVDPSQLQTRPDVIAIPVKPGYVAPSETQHLGRNRYRLGTEDVQTIGDDFPRILSEEVRTRRHRDPKTGRYDGIEITSIAPGSIASRHGAQAGDVVKAINGHPVSSKQEAINFVKNNQEMYEKWEITVENLGQERTVTYLPPKN